VLLPSACAKAQEATDSWLADFDDGTLSGSVAPHYVLRGTGRNDDTRMILQIKDGVVTLGARFDEASARGAGDYVPLNWRNLNVPLADYPIIELRFRPEHRKANVLVQTTLQFADGSKQTPYFYAVAEKPRQWTTQAHRLAGDASLPKKWTPRKLTELNIWVMSDRPATVDFDWVRLRSIGAAERAREDEWISLLKDYDPGKPQVLREFFPFGVYAAPPDTSSEHMMFHRQSFAIMARHHMNFMKAGAPQRRGGRPVDDPLGQVLPIVAAAKENGIRVCLRMRKSTYLFAKQGAQPIVDWAKPFVKLLADRPEVIGYDVGDERPLSALYGVVAAVAILNKLDPSRPSMLTFWDPTSVRAYSPYVPVNVADIYPLRDGSKQTAAYMYEWCRRVARDTDNKRQWVILQSFGCAPWRRGRGYLVPTPAELRLMTWASLAGGARGIIYYSFSYDRYRMMVDQWGNPNELMKEVSRLGEQIIPLGHRILDAPVELDSPITCDNERILVGTLHSPQRDVRYIIAANSDISSPQRGRLTSLPTHPFDLESLSAVPDGQIAELAPGAGRAYFLGSDKQFRLEKAAILELRRDEAERVKTPDRTLAARYSKRLPAALAIRNQLDQIGKLMGSVEPAMYRDNPDAKVVELMNEHRDPYWSVHGPWSEMYNNLLSGELPGEEVAKLTTKASQVVDAIRRSLDGRPMCPSPDRSAK